MLVTACMEVDHRPGTQSLVDVAAISVGFAWKILHLSNRNQHSMHAEIISSYLDNDCI